MHNTFFTSFSSMRFTVHVVVPLLLSAVSLIAALYNVYIFKPNDFDYGLFTNLLWNFANGNGWHVSLYAGQARVFFLADHLALLVPFLSPLFSLFPSPYTLACLHGAAFSATFFLAPAFVKKVWQAVGQENYLGPALFLTLALFVSKGFTAAWSFQAHMTTLVMPFLLCSLLALHHKRLWLSVLFCALVVLAQERAAVAVFGVGMYAFLVTGNRKLGILLCLLSALYFFGAVKVVIPSFNEGETYIYNTYISPFYALDKKLHFLGKFLLIWFMLPLCGKRAMLAVLCASPLLAMGLISNREAMYAFGHQYQDLPSIFFFAAAAQGLLWLSGRNWLQAIPKKALLLATIIMLTLSARESWKVLPLKTLLQASATPEIIALNREISFYEKLPPEVSIYASSGIGPRVSLRKQRFSLTLKSAAQEFHQSVVLLAPEVSIYPIRSFPQLLGILDANPSLRKLTDTTTLIVYVSTDIDLPLKQGEF